MASNGNLDPYRGMKSLASGKCVLNIKDLSRKDL